MRRHEQVSYIPASEHLCFHGLMVRPGTRDECCLALWEEYEPATVKVIPPVEDDDE